MGAHNSCQITSTNLKLSKSIINIEAAKKKLTKSHCQCEITNFKLI